MKKIISTIVIAVTAFSMDANAQVGVNTTAPTATIDVTAKNATGTNTSVDGLLMPRVDRERAQSMTGVPISTLIYVNSIATGTATGTAVNILSIGYYSFDGTVWVKLSQGASATSMSVNSTTGAAYNVNDSGTTTIPGTLQTITVPSGGKALFINFMLGIDYTNNPPGSGSAFYEARLYIDNVSTDAYLRTQEYGPGGLSAQFNLSTVKSLTAGAHTVDVRMRRTANNGTTAGAPMACNPISMSFNATYIN